MTDAETGELAAEMLVVPPVGLELTAWVGVYLGSGRSTHTEVPLGLAETDLILPLDLPDEVDATWARVSVNVEARDPDTEVLFSVEGLDLAVSRGLDGELAVELVSVVEASQVERVAAAPLVATTSMPVGATPPDELGIAEPDQVEEWLGQEVAP